jgi:hypothetical protein
MPNASVLTPHAAVDGAPSFRGPWHAQNPRAIGRSTVPLGPSPVTVTANVTFWLVTDGLSDEVSLTIGMWRFDDLRTIMPNSPAMLMPCPATYTLLPGRARWRTATSTVGPPLCRRQSFDTVRVVLDCQEGVVGTGVGLAVT